MNVHFLQNVSFESPGYLKHLVKKAGHTLSCTHLYKSSDLPDINDFELLVIMGGPMNIYEDAKYPFLSKEKKYIERAISAGKKVLGICLGAQLIADVLGAKVTRNRVKEIGWYPVERSDNIKINDILKVIPEKFLPMHWHGDTFEIPVGAERIGMSAACPNQGFIYDDHVIGLQFHLEVTAESLRDLVINCRDELVDGEFIQKENELFSIAEQSIKPANMILERLFNALISRTLQV